MNINSKERRKFLKTLGVGAVALSIPLIGASNTNINEEKSRTSYLLPMLNGFEFEFLSSGEEFLGIGAIKINDILIRSAILPMFAEIHTPDAIELINYKLVQKSVSEIDVSGISNGIYQVKITSGKTIKNLKLVINK